MKPTDDAETPLEPVKALPPPPGPLPPIPIPPASLKAHLTTAPPEPARESRRRKPRDRPIELPSYTPGAVTIRTQRPVLPTKPAAGPSKQSSIPWGWATALVLVGVGGYIAGSAADLGGTRPSAGAAPSEREPSTPTRVDAAPIAEPTTEAALESEAEIALPEAEVAVPQSAVVALPEAVVALPEAPSSVEQAPSEAIAAKSQVADLPLHPQEERRAARAKEAETSPAPLPAPSTSLDASAASAALARAGAKAMACTDSQGGEGTVSVTFAPFGTAVNVKMDGKYAGTSVAACVEQIFRSTRVSPFEGTPTTVYYTVRLPGDGKPIN